MPHSLPFRPAVLVLCTILLAVFICSCGNGPARSSTTHTTGPGGVTIGQTRADLEAANAEWTVHSTTGATVVYRDYHWSLARGFAHSAEYHHVTYNDHGQVVAWISNSDPTRTKE